MNLEENKINFYQIRDFGDTVNATFTFIKENFKSLGKAILFIAGPVVLISAIIYSYVQSSSIEDAFNGTPKNGFSNLQDKLIPILLFMICSIIISSIVNVYISNYIDKGKNNFTIEDVFNGVKSNFFNLLLISVLCAVILGISMVMLIVPFIYISIPLSLIYPLAIRKNLGFSQAFSKTFELIKGKWWYTLGLILIIGLIVYACSFIFAIPLFVYSILIAFNKAQSTNVDSSYYFMYSVFSGFYIFCYYIITSIMHIGVAVHYYSLSESKEGTSLNAKIAELENFNNENN